MAHAPGRCDEYDRVTVVFHTRLEEEGYVEDQHYLAAGSSKVLPDLLIDQRVEDRLYAAAILGVGEDPICHDAPQLLFVCRKDSPKCAGKPRPHAGIPQKVVHDSVGGHDFGTQFRKEAPHRRLARPHSSNKAEYSPLAASHGNYTKADPAGTISFPGAPGSTVGAVQTSRYPLFSLPNSRACSRHEAY